MKKYLLAIAAILLLIPGSAKAAGPDFIDYGKSSDFIDIDAHLLFGGSYVTNNYASCYSEISDMNSTMGFAYGIGLGVKFNITNFFGIGTGLNYTRNAGKMDMVTTNEGSTNVSNVFIRDRYRSVDLPAYASFTFNLASRVKWNVDGGIYLGFGMGGSRRWTVYNAKINEIGQLITSKLDNKSGYYDDSKAFINSYKKFDWGLHIGTGLTFYEKISVGLYTNIGCKNVAKSTGIVRPSAHNFNFFAAVGYHF